MTEQRTDATGSQFNMSEHVRQRWENAEYRERVLKSMREAGRKRRERNEQTRAAQPKPEPYRVPDLEGETWADIPGFSGHYRISSLGRVKSCDRILPHKHHVSWHIRERILRPGRTGKGKKKYLSVSLHEGGGTMVGMRVHRIVAEAFVPNPHNLPEVNHIDGNTENNAASNLEWVTAKENVEHAWKNGMCRAIVKAHARQIVNLDTGERFDSIREAERKYGGSFGSISHALHGKHEHAHGCRWAFLTDTTTLSGEE